MQRPASQNSDDTFTPEPVSRRMALGVALVSIALLALGTYAVMKLYNTAEQAPYMFRPTAQIIIDNEFSEAHGSRLADSLESALVRGLEGAAGLRVVSDVNADSSPGVDFVLRVGAGATNSDVLFALFERDSADTLWAGLYETNGVMKSFRAGAGPVSALNTFLTTLER